MTECENLDLERGVGLWGEDVEIEHGADHGLEDIQNHGGGIMQACPE